MKLSSLMTRAAAAGAVVGLALIGPAVAAGAASLPVSLPVSVGHVVSGPDVNIVPSPASPVASGADAVVPAHGDGDASVPDPSTGQRLAQSSASGDACVAAALLTGHDVAGCGSADRSGGGSSPSLADSLSRVGACAQLALEEGESTDVCSSSESGAALGVDTGAEPGSGSDPVSGTDVSPFDTAPFDTAPFDTAAVGEVVADNGLCAVVDQLGLAFDACSSKHAANGNGNDSGSGSEAGNGTTHHSAIDLCRGFAVVAGLDLADCTVNAAAQPAPRHSRAGVRGATVDAAGTGAPVPAQLNANCASSTARVGTPSPLSDPTTAGLGMVGALGGLAMAMRRLRRPRLG